MSHDPNHFTTRGWRGHRRVAGVVLSARVLVGLALFMVDACRGVDGATVDDASGDGATCVAAQPFEVSVRDAPYAAAGDGVTDDTAAFQRALDDAGAAVASLVPPSSTPGSTGEEGDPPHAIVFVPVGNYLIGGQLTVPPLVTLIGTLRAPPSLALWAGSTLLAVADAGNANGTAFITLQTHATMRGLSVFYPNQPTAAPPVAYPFTIRGGGPNVSIVDVMLGNSYHGVDLASATSDGHFIRGLYGQPLKYGIVVDHCAGGGRIEDVHLWPFWQTAGPTAARQFQIAAGIAFTFKHAEGEVMKNIFAMSYRTGILFDKSPADACTGMTCGTSSGEITNLNFDTTGTGLAIYGTSGAGWRIDGFNCVDDTGTFEFPIWHLPGEAATVDISNAAFWGYSVGVHGGLQSDVRWQGEGTLRLSNTMMQGWNHLQPAIDVEAGTVTLEGNMFGNGVGAAIAVSGTGHVIATGNQMLGDTITGAVTSTANAL